MKKIKALIIISITILSVQLTRAQSGTMKAPISFKLKSGLTVIVAENLSANKIYASLTCEEKTNNIKAGVYEVLNAMLNETASTNILSFNEKGANIAATLVDFDDAITSLSATLQNPALSQATFDKALSNVKSSVMARDRYYPENITEASLQALTLNDIKAFYTSHAGLTTAYLTIAGNITPAEAKLLTKKSFENWAAPTIHAADSK